MKVKNRVGVFFLLLRVLMGKNITRYGNRVRKLQINGAEHQMK